MPSCTAVSVESFTYLELIQTLQQLFNRSFNLLFSSRYEELRTTFQEVLDIALTFYLAGTSLAASGSHIIINVTMCYAAEVGDTRFVSKLVYSRTLVDDMVC